MKSLLAVLLILSSSSLFCMQGPDIQIALLEKTPKPQPHVAWKRTIITIYPRLNHEDNSYRCTRYAREHPGTAIGLMFGSILVVATSIIAILKHTQSI